MEDLMRGKLLVGTAALVSLMTLAACEDQNSTSSNTSDNRVATAPAGSTSNGTATTTSQATSGKAELDSDTREYVQMAAMGDMFEIESSRVALDRSPSMDVKNIAQEMISAHTMTSDDLKARLARAGLIVETPAMLDSEHQQKVDQLRRASNQEFDAQYLSAQKEAHDEALKLHRDYAMDGKVQELKAFASETAPKVEMHRMMMADLEAKHGSRLSKAEKR
jgi:putative membrane protein